MLEFSVNKNCLSLALMFGAVQSLPLAAQTDDSRVHLTDLSLQELLNIKVVSVTKRPENLSDSPSAIQVITNDQLRRSGATNIPEALRLATNLNIAQQNSHEWIISARGFSSDVGNKLLVLMDGRTLYTPLFSGVFWDRQDYLLEDIDRVEVISGPGGTLWGANAVNGVINLRSKSAEDTQGWYGEAASGDLLETLVGMRYGAALGESTHYRVYGKYSDRDNGQLSNGAEGSDAWNMGQFGFRVDAGTGDDELTWQGDYYDTESWLSHGEQSQTKGGNMLGRWTRSYSETSNSSLQLYFDHTELYLPTPPIILNGSQFAEAGLFADKLDTIDLDFQHSFEAFQAHKVVWGLGYRWTKDEVTNSPGLGFLPPNLSQDLFNAFIQDEIELISETLALTLGSKVEHNDYTGTEWEPNIRLNWRVNSENMVWSAISRAVRMPSRIDREIRQPAPPNLVVLSGGDEFKSERVVAYEVGYRAMLSEQMIVSLALFHNEYSDIRSTNFTPTTLLPFYFENNLHGETQGLELNLNYQALEWWQLQLGYNYLRQDLRVKSGAYDFNNALNETADPKNQVSLRSSMNIGATTTLDLGYRWVDRLPTNNAGQLVYVPSYGELDLRLACIIDRNLEIALVGQNLLHDHHQEFGIPGPTQEEVGRSLFLKLQVRH
jgi:iron complex outermembrane receptor protein